MYSGWSGTKVIAKKNINVGAIIQFINMDIAKMRLSLNTLGRSSYRTLAKGGYIMSIKPIAIGILVEPYWKELINPPTSG